MDKWLIVSALWSATAVVGYWTYFMLTTKWKMNRYIKKYGLNPKTNLECYEIYEKVI